MVADTVEFWTFIQEPNVGRLPSSLTLISNAVIIKNQTKNMLYKLPWVLSSAADSRGRIKKRKHC